MLIVTETLKIEEAALTESFVRSSGPGGQNVNKVATAVQLQLDTNRTSALPEAVKTRLLKLAGKRASTEGVVTIEAKRYRTQEQNRADARERLATLIRKALETPKARQATKVSKAVKARRVDSKKRRGAVKRLRGSVKDEED
jgi:ribosome-associated protein